MPAKSKRAASRQAKLSQKGKRKSTRGPTGMPKIQTPSVQRPDTQDQVPSDPNKQPALAHIHHAETAPGPIDSLGKPIQAVSSELAAISKNVRKTRHSGLAATTYVKREVTRIVIIGGAVMAILITLTFALN